MYLNTSFYKNLGAKVVKVEHNAKQKMIFVSIVETHPAFAEGKVVKFECKTK